MSQAACTRTLSGFRFTWPDLPLAVTLARIREDGRGTRAELVALLVDGEKERVLLHQTVNLLSSKVRLAKELNTRFPAPWDSLLEQVCVLALRSLREGEPVYSLASTEEDAPSAFILNPILYEDEPTVIYGPGDSLKSFFVLYCALLLSNGHAVHPLACSPEPRRVLWLDWEMSLRNVRGRVRLLQHGDPSLVHVPDFRRMVAALADTVDELKALVAEGAYEVLCIDSLGMAAGASELEKAGSAIAFYAAVRALGLPTIIIGHSPKDQEGKGRTLYGNVYFRNLARVAWEVRREGDTIGLYQDKSNLGPLQAPFGLRFVVDEAQTQCTVLEGDLFEKPDLADHLPIWKKIHKALSDHPHQTIDQLAEALDIKKASIKARLYEHIEHFTDDDEGRWICTRPFRT